jgi:hypothetical protein
MTRRVNAGRVTITEGEDGWRVLRTAPIHNFDHALSVADLLIRDLPSCSIVVVHRNGRIVTAHAKGLYDERFEEPAAGDVR